MADNENTINAGDMTINIHGHTSTLDCGCLHHCTCGCYSHGYHGHHGHDGRGGTVVTKRTTSVIYGGDGSNNDGAKANDCCSGTSTSSCADDPIDGVVNPFDTSGVPAAWLATGTITAGDDQSYSVPVGPTSAGYWHLKFNTTTAYTWSISSGSGAVTGSEAIVASGATILQTFIGSAGATQTVVTGHWHATA